MVEKGGPLEDDYTFFNQSFNGGHTPGDASSHSPYDATVQCNKATTNFHPYCLVMKNNYETGNYPSQHFFFQISKQLTSF